MLRFCISNFIKASILLSLVEKSNLTHFEKIGWCFKKMNYVLWNFEVTEVLSWIFEFQLFLLTSVGKWRRVLGFSGLKPNIPRHYNV